MAERTCTISGCEDPVLCRSMCSKHYQQWRKNARPQTRVCSVDECDRPVTSRDLCDLHYRRARRDGTDAALPYKKMPGHRAEERFWAKVNKTETCWLWTGAHAAVGYGHFWVGPGRKMTPAHRWSYERFVGPIPEGYDIDHLCKTPACVNPAHLEAVTPRENIMRSNALGAINARKTHCIRGHEFTPENTRAYVFGDRTHRACRECERTRKERSLAA